MFYEFEYFNLPISETVCSPDLKRFADDNILVWTGQVWDPEAYSLSMQLRSVTFPFVALVVCQSERSFHIVDKVQGYIDDRQLIDRIQAAMPVIQEVQQSARMRLVFKNLCK